MHFIPCSDKEIFNNTYAQIWQYITKNTKEDICCLTKSITITIWELFLKTVTLDVLFLFNLVSPQIIVAKMVCHDISIFQKYTNVNSNSRLLSWYTLSLFLQYHYVKVYIFDSSLKQKWSKNTSDTKSLSQMLLS